MLYNHELKGDELTYALNYHERKRAKRLKQAKEIRMGIINRGEVPDPNEPPEPQTQINSKTLKMLENEGQKLEKLKER